MGSGSGGYSIDFGRLALEAGHGVCYIIPIKTSSVKQGFMAKLWSGTPCGVEFTKGGISH